MLYFGWDLALRIRASNFFDRIAILPNVIYFFNLPDSFLLQKVNLSRDILALINSVTLD